MTDEKPIGIKQVLRLEWLDYTASLLQSGITTPQIRAELAAYLSDRKASGAQESRADKTKSMAVGLLMNIWVTPEKKITPLRNDALAYLRDHSGESCICHWLMYSASYPFFFYVCNVLGSLFNLQNQITKQQILRRVYGIYGDRNTVERCLRYAVRTLVTWGIIADNQKSGVYEKVSPVTVTSNRLATFCLEAALHATTERQAPLAVLTANPAFFAFELPPVSPVALEHENPRLALNRYALGEEYVGLREGAGTVS